MKAEKSKPKPKEMRNKRVRSRQNLYPGKREPVQVFCRLCPTQSGIDASYIKIKSPTTIVMTPLTTTKYDQRIVEYTFQEVFPPETSQQQVFDNVALPLVEGLIKGKNGLLFTYGVTGSGKTYTMIGEKNNCGIVPRCLNVIFKTIKAVQAHKYIFKPDKMNMFDIQSEAEAMLERQQDMYKSKSGHKNNSNPDLTISDTDTKKIEGLNEDNQYAIFITYIEIYNNSAFDLLDDGSAGKPLPIKIIREDASRNMYVHGITEIEIKTVEEAFEVLHMGLKRKRMAHTALNAESSRSHSIFTIRLVQAPVDEMGEAVIQNKKFLSISQLSLVDLAGSERTNRTNNTGDRLRESNSINRSLMTLRTCLELLRQNQRNSSNNLVPYRESRITHLFKNFFEGEGQVRMMVCANPRVEDYDETLQVMRFAELTSEVEVAKPQEIAAPVDFKPGRRKANRLFNIARKKMLKPEAKELKLDLDLVYSLGPDFPSIKMDSPQESHIIKELIAHLEMRIIRMQTLKKSKNLKEEKLRAALLASVNETMEVKIENTSLRNQLVTLENKVKALQNRLVARETSSINNKKKLTEITEIASGLKRNLQQKELLISQNKLHKEKNKQILERKLQHKIAAEQEKAKDINMEKERLRSAMEEKEKKLRIIASALNDRGDNADAIHVSTHNASAQTSVRDFKPGTVPQPLPAHLLEPFSLANVRVTRENIKSRRGVAVANPRYRRSLSADGQGWIEHSPNKIVPMGTVMKPTMGQSKHVNKLTHVKDIANSKISKYCLISQEQDTDGELETKLYKGDIVPTCSGGAQVIFNDVEMLTQSSPKKEKVLITKKSSGCAKHSGKRRDAGCSPPLPPLITRKKQRVDDD